MKSSKELEHREMLKSTVKLQGTRSEVLMVQGREEEVEEVEGVTGLRGATTEVCCLCCTERRHWRQQRVRPSL